MSDRTLVMHEGRLAGQLTQSELNEEAVMRLATGLWYGRRTNPARFEMKKVIGIFVLLIVVCIITTVINPTFLRPYNLENTGLKYLASGRPFSIALPLPRESADESLFSWVAVPMPLIILVVLGVLAAILLNKTIYGRYLLALGRNEQAARYSGINTDRMVILAYVICALLAGLAGVLFALDFNSVQPSIQGNFYELYAIAAAVLGGCSLRGGDGSIFGVIIGAAVIRVLYNAINMLGIATQLEFAIIGAVILLGVIADEVIKRYAARNRANESSTR